MSKLMTRERGVQFMFGFLVGKLVGAFVSTYPLIEIYIEDSNIRDLVTGEFINFLLAFDGYHYALALICGLILVIWRSNDLFE